MGSDPELKHINYPPELQAFARTIYHVMDYIKVKQNGISTFYSYFAGVLLANLNEKVARELAITTDKDVAMATRINEAPFVISLNP